MTSGRWSGCGRDYHPHHPQGRQDQPGRRRISAVLRRSACHQFAVGDLDHERQLGQLSEVPQGHEGACQVSALVDLFEVKPQHTSCRHLGYSPIKRALPYVESARGSYTHRVRNAALHHLEGWPPHVSVSCWCGMSLNIGGRRTVGSKFVAVPSLGRPVCATCEGRAIGAGLEDSHKINGRMVRFQPQIRRAA